MLSVEYAEEAKNTDWRGEDASVDAFYRGESKRVVQSPGAEEFAQKP